MEERLQARAADVEALRRTNAALRARERVLQRAVNASLAHLSALEREAAEHACTREGSAASSGESRNAASAGPAGQSDPVSAGAPPAPAPPPDPALQSALRQLRSSVWSGQADVPQQALRLIGERLRAFVAAFTVRAWGCARHGSA